MEFAISPPKNKIKTNNNSCLNNLGLIFFKEFKLLFRLVAKYKDSIYFIDSHG